MSDKALIQRAIDAMLRYQHLPPCEDEYFELDDGDFIDPRFTDIEGIEDHVISACALGTMYLDGFVMEDEYRIDAIFRKHYGRSIDWTNDYMSRDQVLVELKELLNEYS